MAKKKSEHYVNNRELLEALIVYRAEVKEAAEMIYLNHVSRIIWVLVF